MRVFVSRENLAVFILCAAIYTSVLDILLYVFVYMGECMLLKTFRMFKPVEIYKCDGTMEVVVAVMAAAVAATMNNGTQAFGIAVAAVAARAILSSIANKMRDKCFKYTERQ